MLMSTVLFQAPLRAKKVGYLSIFHFLHNYLPSSLSTLTTVTECFSLNSAMLGYSFWQIKFSSAVQKTTINLLF